METNNSGVELTAFAQLPTDFKLVETEEKPAEDAQKTTDPEPNILKPGSKIKPKVSEEEAIRLAERLYGISTRDISELVAYDDKNFLIHVDTNIKNPIIPNAWPHGYVLKIVNSLDSKKSNVFDGQTQVILFLRQQGINCPKPVMNIFGKYNSIEKIGEATHLVRLLEFIPGKIFNDVLKTKHLFYQVGEFVAKIDSALKRFQHDAYDSYKSIWMLESVPQVSKFLYAIEDPTRRSIVEAVLTEFNAQVMSHFNEFAKGVIHGDCNENNLVVTKVSPESDEFRVTGIIDFGDTCYSLYVFELATTIAYMMLQSGELETGGYVIAGYQQIRPIPENERNVLTICVAARLVQSLVLGAYTHTLDPENDYILLTQKPGWKMLNLLWETPKNEVEELWFTTADEYLKQSDKH